jgi:PAS domain S-box-containing protein
MTSNFWDNPEKYKLIFELSPEAIIILDDKGKFVDTNERISEWLGYKPSEIVGRSLLDAPFLTVKSKAIVAKTYAKRMLGSKIPVYELEFKAKSGLLKVAEIRAVIIKDKNGKSVGDIVMATDITDRKMVEKEVSEKARELERLNSLMIDREIKMVEMKKKLKSNS